VREGQLISEEFMQLHLAGIASQIAEDTRPGKRTNCTECEKVKAKKEEDCNATKVSRQIQKSNSRNRSARFPSSTRKQCQTMGLHPQVHSMN